MEYWSILLSIVIGVLGIHYLFRNYNFFKRHGVIHIAAVPILGNLTSVIFRRISFIDYILKIYNSNPDAKYFGFYATTNPIFLLRDPEIIKSILVKNFDEFPDRRGFNDLNEPLLSNNLFSLRGQKWRNVRSLLSPSFTSSKMKMMFTLMSECAVDFTNFLSTSIPLDNNDMDMKDAFAKYTNDVIATCAFGIKINSVKDPTNKFYVYGNEAVNFFKTHPFKFLFLRTFPTLGRILNVKLIDNHVSDFFKDIIKTTIATRDAENITRPDMIQLMMDVRGKEGRRELDLDDMIAQAFIFFFGGFDTSSTAMSFAAHELAVNTDVQIKLQQEIDKVLEETNGEVTYEIINRLEYLDLVINEVLRLYPPVSVLERVCEKAYELPPTLPGEKPFIMKKGMTFWIPVFAIHRDAKYYDDPEKFCPERFIDNKMYHNSSYYMPFGLGPRMCIANRFAMLEGKKWRDVRSLLSPSFTTSKMKMMFTLMSECAVDFANFWSTSILVDNGDVDMKDAFAKYTNDVIATCAFGIKINSMKDPTNKFYVYGKEAINFFKTNRIRFLFLRTFPKLGRILNVKLIEKFHLERFVDNKMYHNFFCYMPFGLGPRMCIANRVALLEMKVLLFHLLARYELKLCTKTTLPIKFNKKNLIIMPENGFWLNVQHRSDVHPILESIIINDVVKS